LSCNAFTKPIKKYPGQQGAKAGIQRIKNNPRTRDVITALSALRGVFLCWIPAFAGMTG
jgi:hypothetical protein